MRTKEVRRNLLLLAIILVGIGGCSESPTGVRDQQKYASTGQDQCIWIDGQLYCVPSAGAETPTRP